MSRNLRHLRRLTEIRWTSAIAIFMVSALMSSVSWSQVPVPPVPDTVNDTIKSTQDTLKDTTKDAQDTVKDTTKDAKDTVKDTTKDAKDTVKDATKDTTKTTRDTVNDAINKTQETVKDAVRDAQNTARDATRNAEEAIRDATRDVAPARNAREALRDARDATRDLQENTRGILGGVRNGLRGADVGIWFDTSARDGLVIADVDTNGALAAAGFREGDRIVSMNGQPVARETDFMRFVLNESIRDRLPVIVMRDSQQQTLYLEPAVIREQLQTVEQDPLNRFGIAFDDRYPDRLVVWKVFPRTPAYYAGIRAGDVLVSFGDTKLTGSQNFSQVLGGANPGLVQLQVERNSRMRQINVDLPNFQIGGAARTTLRPNLDAELDANAGVIVDDGRGYRRAPRRAGPLRTRRR